MDPRKEYNCKVCGALYGRKEEPAVCCPDAVPAYVWKKGGTVHQYVFQNVDRRRDRAGERLIPALGRTAVMSSKGYCVLRQLFRSLFGSAQK